MEDAMVALALLLAVLAESPIAATIEAPLIDPSAQMNDDLDGWDSTDEPTWAPPPCLAKGVGSIEGTWRSGGGFSSSALELSAKAKTSYRVILSTGGCLGGWRLERSGVLEKGVLQLDRPAQQYTGRPFTRLYVVKSKDGTVLVPSTDIEAVRAEYERRGCGSSIPSPMSAFSPDSVSALPAEAR